MQALGPVASEEVVVELMKKKCLPILYYTIEVSLLTKLILILRILQLEVVLVKYFVRNHEIQLQSVCGYLTISLLRMLLTKEGKIS